MHFAFTYYSTMEDAQKSCIKKIKHVSSSCVGSFFKIGIHNPTVIFKVFLTGEEIAFSDCIMLLCRVAAD